MAGEDLTYGGTVYTTHTGGQASPQNPNPDAYNNLAYNREQGTQGYWEDDPQNPGQKRWVPGQSGVQRDTERYEGLAGRLYQRGAAQADYGDYRYGAGTAQAGIGFQGDALGLQREAAMGNAPSQAEIAGRSAMDRASANQLAAAGSVRGGAMQQAAAYRNAGRINAANQANMQQNIQAGRAAEMAQARAGYSAAAQGYTQAGLGYGQMGLGKSAQELQNEQFQRGLNQQGLQWGEEQARKTKENAQAADLATAQLNEGTYDAASKRQTDKQNADTNERNGWLGLGGILSDERTKKPAMLLMMSDAGAKRGVAVEAIRKWAAADGDPQKQRDIWDSYTGEGLSGGRKNPYEGKSPPAWLEKAERESRSGESDERAAGGRYAGDIIRENPYGSNYREQPERLQSTAEDFKYGEGQSKARGRQEPNMSVDDRQLTSQANDIMEGQRRQLAKPASVNVKQSVKATNPLMQQADSLMAGYQAADAQGPSVIDRGQDDYVYGQPSDERTKNYSDTNTKDIRKEGSSIGFEGGDVFKPKTYDEPGPSSGGEGRPGVHESAKPMGEVDGKMLSIEDATKGAGESAGDERLKQREYSDDKTKLAAAYSAGYGRAHAELSKTSLSERGETLQGNAASGDEVSQRVSEIRKQGVTGDSQEMKTRDALQSARGSVRRAYAAQQYPRGDLNALGKPLTYESPEAARPKQLVTIRQGPATASGKDTASIARSAANEQAEDARVAAAVDRAMPPPQRKVLPTGEVLEPYASSDARTKEDAARKMEGTPYTYKDEYLPPEQKKGEVNVGPMAQNLEQNPITATTVKRDPKTGMRMLDMAKLVKVQSTEIAHLQEQIDEMRYGEPKKKVARG